MQRYSINCADPIETDYGTWCRYSDVKEMEEKLDAANATIKKQAGEIAALNADVDDSKHALFPYISDLESTLSEQVRSIVRNYEIRGNEVMRLRAELTSLRLMKEAAEKWANTHHDKWTALEILAGKGQTK